MWDDNAVPAEQTWGDANAQINTQEAEIAAEYPAGGYSTMIKLDGNGEKSERPPRRSREYGIIMPFPPLTFPLPFFFRPQPVFLLDFFCWI